MKQVKNKECQVIYVFFTLFKVKVPIRWNYSGKNINLVKI